jgi:hypothetical protein
MRYSLWATNRPGATRGWLGQCAYIDAAHRIHARVEDVIRTSKDTGLGHLPSHDYGLNRAWLDASMTACVLLAWLRLLALDGDLTRAEPKTLRYRVLHAAARLVRRRAATMAENRRGLALGRGSGSKPCRKHLDHHAPVPASKKEDPGSVEPPATRPDSRAAVLPGH